MPTEEARRLLPSRVPYRDAVFNLGRAALLIAAFQTGQLELLRIATEDRLHQPYRREMFPAMPRFIGAALEAGALGACLSGAGSAIISLTRGARGGRRGGLPRDRRADGRLGPDHGHRRRPAGRAGRARGHRPADARVALAQRR